MDNYMIEALKEANKAYKIGEVPVGCVIVKDEKIIARAHNLKEKKQKCTQHAEIIAINKASKKLKNWRLLDCEIYVTLFPCPMCAGAINQARINSVYYGTIPDNTDVNMTKSILKDNKYGIPIKKIESLMEKECTELLKKFFVKKRQ